MNPVHFTSAGALRKLASTFMLLCLGIFGQAHGASTSLDQSWQFYRDDARKVTTVEQVPPGAWTRVNLPHAARLEPRVPTAPWQGTVFYKRKLQASLRPGERAILRFEGVMNVADVWLNGKHLGQHLGSYLPFAFDITSSLKAGGDNTGGARE